jgi:hypothetical protein
MPAGTTPSGPTVSAEPAAAGVTPAEPPAAGAIPGASPGRLSRLRPSLPRPSLRRPSLPSIGRPSVPRPPRPSVSPFFWRRLAALALVILVVGGIATGGYFAGKALFGNGEPVAGTVAPAPAIVVHTPQPAAAQDVGFPEFATKNTTRVGGADPVADAAGVALATHPSAGGLEQPAAVSLVPDDDWQAGIVAAELTAAPIGAPILLDGADGLPPLSADALNAMAPTGSSETDNKQLFLIGGATSPGGSATTASVDAADPARLAVGVAALRQKLVNAPPAHIILVNSSSAAYAMPAASWAARSGDAILFVDRDSLPAATAAALKRYVGVPTYLLAPSSIVTDQAFKQIQKIAPQTRRISAADPVASAVEFARYSDAAFGWNINDPGHGFVIADVGRPLDAAAAAPLSASGNWGPLLVTDSAAAPPGPLRSYLLDLKPGYEADPTRAVYNHVWLIGDKAAMSVPFQSEIDALAEAAKIRSGAGGGLASPAGSETEQKQPQKP